MQAQIRSAVGQADLIHYQTVAKVGAQTEAVRNTALTQALQAGADPDSFDGAALTLSFLGDPANYVLPAALKAGGELLSLADKPMLGIAEGYRLKVATLSATQASLAKTIAEMTAAGSDYAAERLPDLTEAHGAVSGELQQAQKGLDAACASDSAWLADHGPSVVQNAVGGAAKGVGSMIEGAGQALTDLNTRVVDGLTAPANGAPSALANAASKLVKQVAPTALIGGAIGALAGGDSDSIAKGAEVGAVAPLAITYAGRLTRLLGETYSLGQSTIPFLQRFASNAEATGLEAWLARKIDPFEGFQAGAGTVANTFAFAKRAAAAGASTVADSATGLIKGAVSGAAAGYVATGGDDQGAAQGAGAAVAGHFAPWAIIGGFYNAFRPAASPEDLVAQRVGNLALLKQKWAEDPASLERLNLLTPGQQLDFSSVVAANPDFSLLLTNRPGDQAKIAVDNIGSGKDLPDLSTVPAVHYMDPASGRSVIAINPLDPNPNNMLQGVLAHEFVHKALASGLADSMIRQVVGDSDLGQPGLYTQIGAAGTPVRNPDGSFAVTPDYTAAKQAYIDRVRSLGNPQFEISDKDFALEHGAEAGADYLLGQGGNLFRPTVGSMVNEALGGNLFNRNVLAKFGVPFTPEGAVKGTMDLPGLRHSDEVTKLIADYTKKWAQGATSEGEPAPVSVSREAVLNNPSLLKTVFGGSSELHWDSLTGMPRGVEIRDGKPVVVNETAMFKSARQIQADQMQMAAQIKKAVDSAKDVASDPLAVKPKVVDGQKVYEGRYLSDQTIAALDAGGKLNPIQVQNLRNLSALLKTGSGDYVKFLYQPSTTVGARYRSLSGEWRSEVPVSMRITSHGNVTFNTVSFDRVVDNLRKAWLKDSDRATGLWASQQSMVADAREYIDNITSGKPGAEGLSPAKRDFVNLALGISTKGRAAANPLFDDGAKRIRSVFTTRRIDRVVRLSSGERSDKIPWSSEAYSRARLNLTAGQAQ